MMGNVRPSGIAGGWCETHGATPNSMVTLRPGR
jgi:hypothetical protein